MGQVLVNFRMDENLKKDMEIICRELGMNMTTAFTIFAKKLTREQRIPFDINLPLKEPEKVDVQSDKDLSDLYLDYVI